MATVVTHSEKPGTFILLGAGYGAYHSSKPGAFLGNLLPDENSGQFPLVLVANREGRLGWMEYEKVRVVSIDGLTPAQALSDT